MNRINDFFKNHKNTLFILILLLVIAFLIYNHKHTEQAPEQITAEQLKESAEEQGKEVSQNDSNDIQHLINTDIQKPTHVFYTTNEQQADKQVEQYKKANKADFIVKQQEQPQKVGDNTIYQNSYYAISQERKHGISAGVAIIDNKARASVSYRNRRMTYSVYYTPTNGNVGAGVAYEFARW